MEEINSILCWEKKLCPNLLDDPWYDEFSMKLFPHSVSHFHVWLKAHYFQYSFIDFVQLNYLHEGNSQQYVGDEGSVVCKNPIRILLINPYAYAHTFIHNEFKIIKCIVLIVGVIKGLQIIMRRLKMEMAVNGMKVTRTIECFSCMHTYLHHIRNTTQWKIFQKKWMDD